MAPSHEAFIQKSADSYGFLCRMSALTKKTNPRASIGMRSDEINVIWEWLRDTERANKSARKRHKILRPFAHFLISINRKLNANIYDDYSTFRDDNNNNNGYICDCFRFGWCALILINYDAWPRWPASALVATSMSVSFRLNKFVSSPQLHTHRTPVKFSIIAKRKPFQNIRL